MVPRYTVKAKSESFLGGHQGVLTVRLNKNGDFCKYAEVATELDKIEPLELDLKEMTERADIWRKLCHKQEQTIIDLKHQLALCGVIV